MERVLTFLYAYTLQIPDHARCAGVRAACIYRECIDMHRGCARVRRHVSFLHQINIQHGEHIDVQSTPTHHVHALPYTRSCTHLHDACHTAGEWPRVHPHGWVYCRADHASIRVEHEFLSRNHALCSIPRIVHRRPLQYRGAQKPEQQRAR